MLDLRRRQFITLLGRVAVWLLAATGGSRCLRINSMSVTPMMVKPSISLPGGVYEVIRTCLKIA
jgi:hypothetical protein